MIDHGNDPANPAGRPANSQEIEVEPALGALTEQITRRLESGEAVDADDYARRFPEWADSLQAMLPAIRELVELGRSVARGRPARIADSECQIPDLRDGVSQ